MNSKNKKFEAVFDWDKDWQNNACLNWSHDPIQLYTTGYKEAGDQLAEYIIKNGCKQDAFIYPIVFLYRQYIELRLKEIIREGNILLEEKHSSPGYPTVHRIDNLWEKAKLIVAKAFKNEVNHLDIKYLDHVINEFDKIDPDSYSSRYPTTKSGERTLKGVMYINIRRLRHHVTELARNLDEISLGIDWQQENEQQN